MGPRNCCCDHDDQSAPHAGRAAPDSADTVANTLCSRSQRHQRWNTMSAVIGGQTHPDGVVHATSGRGRWQLRADVDARMRLCEKSMLPSAGAFVRWLDFHMSDTRDTSTARTAARQGDTARSAPGWHGSAPG